MDIILSFLQKTIVFIGGFAAYITLAFGVLHMLFIAVLSIILLFRFGFLRDDRISYQLWMIWIYVLSLSSGFIGSAVVYHVVELDKSDVDLLCGQAFFTAYLVVYHILYNVYLINQKKCDDKTSKDAVEKKVEESGK